MESQQYLQFVQSHPLFGKNDRNYIEDIIDFINIRRGIKNESSWF
jgi:hypothetical protein